MELVEEDSTNYTTGSTRFILDQTFHAALAEAGLADNVDYRSTVHGLVGGTQLLDQLRRLALGSLAVGLPVEVMVRKKEFEYIVRSGMENNGQYRLPSKLHGWRKALIGDELLRVAKEFPKTGSG